MARLEQKMKKEVSLYAAVSVVALAVDVAILYIAAVHLAAPAYLAAALAYAAGVVVHYRLSVRYVFVYRRLASNPRSEAMIYALTGFVGTLLSAGIVQVGSLLEQSLALSKLAAIAVSFIAVFIIRKVTLFSTAANRWKGTL